jgi:predicted PilT family ATPase
MEQKMQNNIDEDEMLEQASLCGVIIIGAPGTGKTTFCNALQQFM